MTIELPSLNIELSQVFILLDIFFVYYLIYRFLLWAQRTRVLNLIKGFFWILLLYPLSEFIGLTTLSWLLGKFTTVLILLTIIIFQPELRRFLERLGTSLQLFSPLLIQTEGQGTSIIKHILKSVETLSREKIGALIVIEVSTNLSEFIESGVNVHSHISHDLLSSLFWPGSPIHDGAVIIRENRIESAGCLLPLTEISIADRRLGTRHRAALGLSEISDAFIIVISEETGVISLAENGELTRYLTKEALETHLFNLYKKEITHEQNGLYQHFFKMFNRKKSAQ